MLAQKENTALLLQYGADPDARASDGQTALMYACASPARAGLLLQAGANPNAKDHKGTTPLMVAAAPEVIVLLLKYRADVNARDNAGHSALYYLQHGDAGDLPPEMRDRMIRLLKAQGARE